MTYHDARLANDLARLDAHAGVFAAAEAMRDDRLSRALVLARSVGAPVSSALDAAAQAQAAIDETARSVNVASAQSRAVAIGLVCAPGLLLPLLSRITGVNMLAFYRTGSGVVVLAVGASMVALGSAIILWMVARAGDSGAVHERGHRGIVLLAPAAVWLAVGAAAALLAGVIAATVMTWVRRRQRTTGGHVGRLDEALDLAATAMEGGCSIPQALRMAAQSLPDAADWLCQVAFELDAGAALAQSLSARDVDACDAQGRTRAVLAAAHRTGAPVVDILRRVAADERADAHAEVLARVERLPAQLTFPTALLLLPGVVLLAGAPIVAAGIDGLM